MSRTTAATVALPNAATAISGRMPERSSAYEVRTSSRSVLASASGSVSARTFSRPGPDSSAAIALARRGSSLAVRAEGAGASCQ